MKYVPFFSLNVYILLLAWEFVLLQQNKVKLVSLVCKVIRLGMFEVHCDELIRSLSKRAEAICQKLLHRMAKDHQQANKECVHQA